MRKDLSGIWKCEIPGQEGELALPGTLDESGLGGPDDPQRQWKAEEVRRIGFWQDGDPIVTRLTRKASFEGTARISRQVQWECPAGKRVFLDCERARHLRLLVNGRPAAPAVPGCLSAPYVFEITGLVTGRDELAFLSDNGYPGWPRDAIVYSSAASDETQTNWNGLLGFLRLRTEEADFLSGLRVYPRGNRAEIVAELNLSREWEGTLRFHSPALEREETVRCGCLQPGIREVRAVVPFRRDVKRWDLGEGSLYSLTAEPEGMESRTVRFGVRDFSAEEGHLALNGRRIFLRGETNCAVFPETGYCPMDPASWKRILERYRAYGVNFVRFHSHCPPEAAFEAADEAGMLLQPELSHWDPAHAFATAEAREYYGTEAKRILDHLANHPSFVMMTLGNELQADEEGQRFMACLLRQMREQDPTRLYANGSNPFYGEKGPDPASDFFTASDDRGRMLRATSAEFRGWLNREPAGAGRDYSAEMRILRQAGDHPVFSFEVGQYEVLPDFGEIPLYRGVTRPENLMHVRRKVREAGLEGVWTQWAEATGENALQCYRAETEAAMRTEDFSGIVLLGLQDFPGQGTALVGMMNAHLEPKPYDFARPERFAAFFRDVLPMALLPKYVFTAGEEGSIPLCVANYGRQDLSGCPEWKLANGKEILLSGKGQEVSAPAGRLSRMETLAVRMPEGSGPARLALSVEFCGQKNEYPLWVYPEVRPACPPGVYECRALDAVSRKVLASGGRVFLAPDSTAEALPRSVQAQFSPDFWSVCTFPEQAGCMGQLMDTAHPVFRRFPTDRFSSWQWRPMAEQRAMILPRRMKTIIAEMDSFAFLRPMAKLFECRYGGGRMLVSSLGLHQLLQEPNARALLQAVYDYLDSEDFRPEQELSAEEAMQFLPMV